ncbi:hypothetical protein JHK86_005629 [Glycine max]|nr:hypothetical protein JHK86_005629 [Glycine max]
MCKFGCHRKVTGPEKFVVKLFPPLWWSHYVLMGQNMASTIQKMKCLKAARVNVAFFCLNSEPAMGCKSSVDSRLIFGAIQKIIEARAARKKEEYLKNPDLAQIFFYQQLLFSGSVLKDKNSAFTKAHICFSFCVLKQEAIRTPIEQQHTAFRLSDIPIDSKNPTTVPVFN